MCLYRYWGYDVCSHEYPSEENQWEPCRVKHYTLPPFRCPLMQFARIKVGINFCESCLDHTPPDHPPINEFMEAFDELVALVSEFGLSRSDVNRFTRDIRDGLKEIRDNAALAGVDNNFYNDIKNLYELFFDRVMRARDQAIARRQARRAREQGEASGSQG